MEHLPVDIIGLNCSTGPEHMREPARYLGEYSTKTGFDHPERRDSDQCQWAGVLSAPAGRDERPDAGDG